MNGLNKGSPCRSPATTNSGESYHKHSSGSTLPSYNSARILGGGSAGHGVGPGTMLMQTTHADDLRTANGGTNPLLQQSLVRRSSPNSSSQYSQHWRMKKEGESRCSWKFVAIFFILLSVILVSALVYTTGRFRFPYFLC